MRDRLKKLIESHIVTAHSKLGDYWNEKAIESLADHLLANGVIVPPCKVGQTVTNEELLPCPFCGGEAIISKISNYHDSCVSGFTFTILCKKCALRLPQKFNIGFVLSEKGEAILGPAYEGVIEAAKDMWNRRADDGKR